MTAALSVRLLGPMQVDREGRPVVIGAAKLRVVLALLALRSGEVVSADALIDGLWPGVPPATAAKTLQGYISELRRLLQPGVAPDHSAIATQPPGYLLQLPAEAVDLAQFERLWRAGRQALSENPARAQPLLESALGLWRGEPLADIATQGAISLEVGRLQELRLACRRTGRRRPWRRRRSGGGPRLERLVAAHPLRERLCRQLMLALYRGGRQADALEVAARVAGAAARAGHQPVAGDGRARAGHPQPRAGAGTQPPSAPASARRAPHADGGLSGRLRPAVALRSGNADRGGRGRP